MQTQTTTTNKAEILTLIAADMRNRKLIMGLEQAGLGAEAYYCDLTELILTKIGFGTVTDEIFNWYQTTLEEIIVTDTRIFMRTQQMLAEEMYALIVNCLNQDL